MADGNSGLQVIDISTPSSPSIISSVETLDVAYGVYVSGSYAYVAGGDSGLAGGDLGLQVLDISNPSSSAIIGSVEIPDGVIPAYVYVSGRYAYVIATKPDRKSVG